MMLEDVNAENALSVIILLHVFECLMH